ncbi:MAG: hypothetical protein WAV90_00710 [Gordonia amarae]
MYTPSLLAKKQWLTTAPKDVPLGDDIGTGIHHFLLPSHGWGAAIDTTEAKTYAPEKREELRLWRNDIRKSPSKPITKRLQALTQRVETLWEFTLRRLTIAESEIRRDVHLWGSIPVAHTPAVTREQIEKVLSDPDGAYQRLRRVMDAWCALWAWPLTSDIDPPDWDQWAGGLEAILGLPPRAGKFERYGQTSLANDMSWQDLDIAEDTDRTFAQAQPTSKALASFPWLQIAEDVADAQGFFHWELDFAPVFARGGFDLQVGNPPWVRPDWDEASFLAEFDPSWQLTPKMPESIKQAKRNELLSVQTVRDSYLNERSEQSGTTASLSSSIDRPLLSGLRTDLYRCFMDKSWLTTNHGGIVGLIHPESHFTEVRAKNLRRETYYRLKRHWQFRNEAKLFEIHHAKEYGVHVYGRPSPIYFLQGSSLYHPDTVQRSFNHDGTGPTPGVKDPNGKWDMRPHAERIVRVTFEQLTTWSRIVEEPGSRPDETRLLYPINRSTAGVLDKISSAPRISEVPFEWTLGWDEAAARRKGFIVSESATRDRWDEAILQGPHISTACAIHQQPDSNPNRAHLYAPIDLEKISEEFIPRTNYKIGKSKSEYFAAYPHWDTRPSNELFRVAWREMCDVATARTLHSALLPPGPSHVGGIMSLSMDNYSDLATCAASTSSLVSDFLIKVMGNGHIKTSALGRLPMVRNHPLQNALVLRTLRLNCLVSEYAELWSSLYDPAWQRESWVNGIGIDYNGRTGLGDVGPEWHLATPFRRAADRRQAEIEIDAILAVMLGITAEEISIVYRTQFPILQKYDRTALYDSAGRRLPAAVETDLRTSGHFDPGDVTIDGTRYEYPFHSVDRERDIEIAHKYFASTLAKNHLVH